MTRPHIVSLGLLAAALTMLPGCVELTGQRISWFYDEAKDELQILVYYDGIHDSGSDEHGKGAEQIPKFVANGDAMLLDWPFHLDAKSNEASAKAANGDILQVRLARLLTRVRTEPLGYYREPDGRVGAAQRIVIPDASDFIEELNGIISQGVRERGLLSGLSSPRTVAMCKKAAANDHQWLALDGHAVCVTFPVNPREWMVLKADLLSQVARDLVGKESANPEDEEWQEVLRGILALASTPISYVDEGDSVTLRFGASKKPPMMRLTIRDEYEPSLEEVVADSLQVDLDRRRAELLDLEDVSEASPKIVGPLCWGPPEEQVRYLLVAAEQGKPSQQKAAAERLAAWAKQWNQESGLPEAPAALDGSKPNLAAWKAWYAKMRRPWSETQDDPPTEEKEATAERIVPSTRDA